MRVEQEPQDWTGFYEINPAQHAAGLEWLRSGQGLNYNYSDEDLSFLRVYLMSPEQVQTFTEVLNGAE